MLYACLWTRLAFVSVAMDALFATEVERNPSNLLAKIEAEGPSHAEGEMPDYALKLPYPGDGGLSRGNPR